MRAYSPRHAVHAQNQKDDCMHAHTHTHTLIQYTCTVPWQSVFPQHGPVILRLKEFAVDYFWTEAGSFGKERPGHFEDLTSSSRCLPTALGAAQTPATHTHTHPHTHTHTHTHTHARARMRAAS